MVSPASDEEAVLREHGIATENEAGCDSAPEACGKPTRRAFGYTDARAGAPFAGNRRVPSCQPVLAVHILS